MNTLYSVIRDVAKENPKDIAIFYRGKKISYKSLMNEVDKYADIFANVLKIKKGDVILVSQPNIPDTLIIIYALNKIGAICNMVHPFTPYNQIVAIMAKTNTKYAFLFEQRVAKEVEKYRDIKDKVYISRIENYLPFFSRIIYHCFMNFRIRNKLGKIKGFNGFNYLHKLKPTNSFVETIDNEDNCTVILHSGSTTGEPKIICHSDKSFNCIASHADFFCGMDAAELRGLKMLSALPSFHGFGLEMTMHLPLANNMGCVLIPKFNAENVNKALKQTKFHLICGVPTLYEKLFNDEKFIHNKYLKDVKCCFSGGDGMSESLKTKINTYFENNNSKCRVFEGYGLTEALAANTLNTPIYYKAGSIGKPFPGVDVKIFKEDGSEANANEIGEIAIKSDANMLCYLNDEEATKSCVKNGYLFTGDYGIKDEDGFIFFKSRMKRVVKVSGVAVFPSEVEQLIESIPEVEKVAVIGIADKDMQSALKAIVVAKYFDEEEMRRKILSTCNKYLIRWSVPKQIEFRKELPVTKLGKIDYKQLS